MRSLFLYKVNANHQDPIILCLRQCSSYLHYHAYKNSTWNFKTPLSLYKFKGQGQSHCFKDVEVESIQKLEVNYISIKNLMKVYNKPISFQSPAFKHWIESGKILVLGFFSPFLVLRNQRGKLLSRIQDTFPTAFKKKKGNMHTGVQKEARPKHTPEMQRELW